MPRSYDRGFRILQGMCDTFYIPADNSTTGYPILAKNSDREPNEAQHLLHIPRRFHAGSSVRATFVTLPHSELRHAVILSKPFHMWGAEMGINEHGLSIGNEAVFTRIPFAKKNNGLTGMDMIRLALESCTTAAEARDRICAWTVSPGQDACGGYQDRNFFYHNSYIIADPREAFVLETAGPHWAWKRLTGFHAISNRLSLSADYDRASEGVMGKDFAATFSAPLLSRLSKGRQRKALCTNKAAEIIAQRPFTIADAFSVLRVHHVEEGFLPHHAGMDNLCLHAHGLLTPSQTTGSMVMELRAQGRPQVWATGSAAHCLSVFKPIFFNATNLDEENFPAPGPRVDNSYWWTWERWHRRALRQYPQAKKLWSKYLGPLERQWIDQWDDVPDAEAGAFSARCFSGSLDRLSAIMNELTADPYPGIAYRWHWHARDRKAGI